MINYYSWLTLNNSNTSWMAVDSVLNWTDSSSLLSSDFLLFGIFFLENFSSVYFSTYSRGFSSFTDLIFANSALNLTPLYLAFYFDLYLLLSSTLPYGTFSMQLEGFNLVNLYLQTNPELLQVYFNFMSFCNQLTPNVMQFYNVFFFNFQTVNSSFITSALSLFSFCIYFFLVSAFLALSPISGLFYFVWFRFVSFLSNFSFENRFQFDWSLTFLSFIFFLWLPLLISYDDVNVEITEVVHNGICLLFLFVIFFFIVKYSTHYFSFLENSVTEGYSSSFIAKQFVRDVSNSFALFLRFFLLLFRLNIYDGLDDFLDSYYIFFIDFDEDSYFDELMWLESTFIFNTDNAEDSVFFSPTELDFFTDLFSRYFVTLGKFLFFWAFILEEIFRVSLAFYISYLIIFEVHAVNVSYNESNFISSKR